MNLALKPETLAQKIDYTFLKPIFEREEWETFLARSKDYPFRGICVPPFLVRDAKKAFSGRIISVAGFPLGFQLFQSKAEEIKKLFSEGADEVDFVVNLHLVRVKDSESLGRELESIKRASQGRVLKVIIETPILKPHEIDFVVSLLISQGFDFVKTSTGFMGKATTIEEVKLLHKLSQGRISIKASGGIGNLESALAFLEAGADIIGTSRGYEIIEELRKRAIAEEGESVIHVYVDGCSLGNPGPGGYGAIIKDNDSEKVISGGEPNTTNNRMELLAVIKALAYYKDSKKIYVYTDSEYVLKGATQWLSNWKKRGFKNAEGSEIKNLDLWQELDRLVNFHKVTFIKVQAHAGHPENERADQLAKREARAWKRKF
ncbi:MAG: ribonuclease HI [Caldimicrobium sp.]|nr:ribonuclease HI [Caldimicrobium sp.]MCX7614068.1 ribonuclease HI [Caldimicrobium sp.]MDW8182853.1 ribonuclease HI [Caldimicrobium sp.]